MHACLQYTCTCLHARKNNDWPVLWYAQIHCIDVRFVMPIDHIKWGLYTGKHHTLCNRKYLLYKHFAHLSYSYITEIFSGIIFCLYSLYMYMQ